MLEYTDSGGYAETPIIEWTRTYFRSNEGPEALDSIQTLNHRLNLSEIESLGLPYESYRAALTDNLVTVIYGNDPLGSPRVSGNMRKEGGYHVEPDVSGYWWIPSGRQAFKEDGFYRPHQTQDPFGNVSEVTYDKYSLLIESTLDPLQNKILAKNDYRVLQPQQITDPNANIAQVAFDTLGLVVGTAVLGKGSQGDSLNNFIPDLTETQIAADIADPFANAHGILGAATTRLVYDLHRYHKQGKPNVVHTLARETHASAPGGAQTRIQHGLVYSDGFSRVIQSKIQAEPAPGASARRWVGSGWTIFNNKGKPVQQYEPFFTSTHELEFNVQVGVSPTLFYDPLERAVCTLHPNHTYGEGSLRSVASGGVGCQ